MNRKLILLAILLLDASLFFLAAFSSLSDFAKIVLCLAILAAGGIASAKSAGWESYFGVNMVRGKYGFHAMSIGRRHPKFFRFLADLGAGVGYGLPYSFYAYRKKPVLFGAILLFCAAFSFLLAAGHASSPAQFFETPLAVAMLAAGLLGGLTLQSIASLMLSAFRILTVPGAPAGAQLLIVGVTVPWEWVFGLIIAASVHEFAHGVLCRAEKLRVTSSGVILFGFMPLGAFVEPDEERFKKLGIEKKRRILAAGPASNLVAFCAFLGLLLAITPVLAPAYQEMSCLKILSVNASYAGSFALATGDLVTQADGVPVQSVSDLSTVLAGHAPGDAVVLGTADGSAREVFLDSESGKLGITVLPAAKPGFELSFWFIGFILTVIASTAYLNLAIGSINLVPLFITDGGRIAFEDLNYSMKKRFGSRRGAALARKLSVATSATALFLVLSNLLLPSALKLIS